MWKYNYLSMHLSGNIYYFDIIYGCIHSHFYQTRLSNKCKQWVFFLFHTNKQTVAVGDLQKEFPHRTNKQIPVDNMEQWNMVFSHEGKQQETGTVDCGHVKTHRDSTESEAARCSPSVDQAPKLLMASFPLYLWSRSVTVDYFLSGTSAGYRKPLFPMVSVGLVGSLGCPGVFLMTSSMSVVIVTSAATATAVM